MTTASSEFEESGRQIQRIFHDLSDHGASAMFYSFLAKGEIPSRYAAEKMKGHVPFAFSNVFTRTKTGVTNSEVIVMWDSFLDRLKPNWVSTINRLEISENKADRVSGDPERIHESRLEEVYRSFLMKWEIPGKPEIERMKWRAAPSFKVSFGEKMESRAGILKSWIAFLDRIQPQDQIKADSKSKSVTKVKTLHKEEPWAGFLKILEGVLIHFGVIEATHIQGDRCFLNEHRETLKRLGIRDEPSEIPLNPLFKENIAKATERERINRRFEEENRHKVMEHANLVSSYSAAMKALSGINLSLEYLERHLAELRKEWPKDDEELRRRTKVLKSIHSDWIEEQRAKGICWRCKTSLCNDCGRCRCSRVSVENGLCNECYCPKCGTDHPKRCEWCKKCAGCDSGFTDGLCGVHYEDYCD